MEWHTVAVLVAVLEVVIVVVLVIVVMVASLSLTPPLSQEVICVFLQ